MRDLYIRSMGLLEPLPRESYLAKLPVVKYLADNGITFHKQVTFFVGENGSGKSTLIEALAISQGFNPEGGTKNFHFSTENSHSELCNYLKVVRGFLHPRTVSSSGQRVSIMWRPILTRWTGSPGAGAL